MNLKDAFRSPVLVVDTEGNAKDYRHDRDAQTMGVSVGFRGSGPIESEYFAYHHTIGPNLPLSHLDELRDVIEAHPIIVCHNWKYDVLALENLGINVRHKKFYDTMLMVHWVNENLINKGLDYASTYYGGQPKNRPLIMKQIIKALGWEWIPAKMMAEYSANDSFITYELFETLLPLFQEEGYDGELWEIEQEFARLVIRMESFGVGVDNDLCLAEIETGEQRMKEISDSLNGLNPNSPKDLEVMLIDILDLPVFKTTPSGKPGFDREAMEFYESELTHLDNDTAHLVLEYRGWLKALSAYYKAYLNLQSTSGNLHPNFKLHGTRTGRLSCEHPNLQQIPRQSSKRWNGNSKRAIRNRPGFTLWEADYSNLEFRLSAIYSGEPNMIKPLQEGFKPFDAMAELIFGVYWTDEQRQMIKIFTYMTSYGAGIAKVARFMHLSDKDAKELRANFYAAYPRVKAVTQAATAKADARGYALLWTGRRRHFDAGMSTHKAFNAVMQGGAAELVKRIMLAVNEVIDWDECKMLLQIHDSIVFEIKDGTEAYWLPIIRTVMENVAVLHPRFGLVPFPTEIKKWGTDIKWLGI